LYFCYILRCSDESYYVGISDDPSRREQEHNEGKGSDWTSADGLFIWSGPRNIRTYLPLGSVKIN
jgi:predicted GIY-YIG superfamily endonuclease